MIWTVDIEQWRDWKAPLWNESREMAFEQTKLIFSSASAGDWIASEQDTSDVQVRKHSQGHNGLLPWDELKRKVSEQTRLTTAQANVTDQNASKQDINWMSGLLQTLRPGVLEYKEKDSQTQMKKQTGNWDDVIRVQGSSQAALLVLASVLLSSDQALFSGHLVEVWSSVEYRENLLLNTIKDVRKYLVGRKWRNQEDPILECHNPFVKSQNQFNHELNKHLQGSLSCWYCAVCNYLQNIFHQLSPNLNLHCYHLNKHYSIVTVNSRYIMLHKNLGPVGNGAPISIPCESGVCNRYEALISFISLLLACPWGAIRT